MADVVTDLKSRIDKTLDDLKKELTKAEASQKIEELKEKTGR